MCIPCSPWVLPTPTYMNTNLGTLTPISSICWPQSPLLTSICNIVAAWKECTPTSTAKSNCNQSTPWSATSTKVASSSDCGEGLFSLRRWAKRGGWDWEIQWWVVEEGKLERALGMRTVYTARILSCSHRVQSLPPVADWPPNVTMCHGWPPPAISCPSANFPWLTSQLCF